MSGHRHIKPTVLVIAPSQNEAEVPKHFASRNAVSAGMPRQHFVISVRREAGMPVERDTDARLIPIGLMAQEDQCSPICWAHSGRTSLARAMNRPSFSWRRYSA